MFNRALGIILSLGLVFAGVERAHAAPPPAGAPASASDEVRLTSGGFVRGTIVDYAPGEYVVIVPVGQEDPRRYEWADVDEVVRGSQATSGATDSGGIPAGPAAPAIPGSMPAVEPPPGVPGGALDPDAGRPSGPAPGGVVDEVDAERPGPSPATPAITIEQTRGKNVATLYHLDAEAFGQAPGVTIHAIAYSAVCDAPCVGTLTRKRGEYFVGGQGYGFSKRFTLPGARSQYTLRVTPRPKALSWTGWLTVALFASGGVLLATTPTLVNMPKTAAPGFYAGGAVLGALGVAGGIVMIAFSRTKVEFVPGRGG